MTSSWRRPGYRCSTVFAVLFQPRAMSSYVFFWWTQCCESRQWRFAEFSTVQSTPAKPHLSGWISHWLQQLSPDDLLDCRMPARYSMCDYLHKHCNVLMCFHSPACEYSRFISHSDVLVPVIYTASLLINKMNEWMNKQTKMNCCIMHFSSASGLLVPGEVQQLTLC